jgi:hypothetical protein
VDYLLLHYDFASALWNTFFSSVWFGWGYVWKGGRPLCLLESVRGRSQLDAVWKMIPPLPYVVYMEVKKRS